MWVAAKIKQQTPKRASLGERDTGCVSYHEDRDGGRGSCYTTSRICPFVNAILNTVELALFSGTLAAMKSDGLPLLGASLRV